MREFKSFFAYFDESENMLRLAVKLLSEEERAAIYEKYDEDLSNIQIKKLKTRKSVSYIRNVVFRNIQKILRYLRNQEINEEKAINILQDKNEFLTLEEKYKTFIFNRSQGLNFFSKFNASKNMVLLSFYFLSEKEQKLIKLKYGEELNCNCKVDFNWKITPIINKIKSILRFLNREKINDEKAVYLLDKDHEDELRDLKTKYIILCEKNSNKKVKSLITYFDTSKELLEVATKFLRDKELVVLLKKYDDNFMPKCILSHNEQSYLNVVVLPKLENIIKFLKNEINEEEASFLVSEDGKVEFDELKNSWNNTIKDRKERYNSLFSYFDVPDDLVKLSVLFLNERYQNLIYSKYGKELNNVDRVLSVTENDNKEISGKCIPKMKEILEFLKSKNFNDEHVKFLLSKSGKRKLYNLIEEFNSLKSKSKKSRKSKSKRYFFSYFEEDEILVRFALLILNEEERNLLFRKYDDLLDFDYEVEPLNEEDEALVDGKLISKLHNILNFMKIKGITINDVNAMIENKDLIMNFKSEYYISNKGENNKGRYKSFLSCFDESEIMVRLAIKFLRSREKQVLFKKYDEDLNNVIGRNYVKQKDIVYITTIVIPDVKDIIVFLKNHEVNELVAVYLMSDEGMERLNYFRDEWSKDKKAKDKRGFNGYVKDYRSLFSYYECSKNIVILAIKMLDIEDRVMIYKKYGETLENVKTVNLSSEERTRIRNLKYIYLKRIIQFLVYLDMSEEEINYLISSKDETVISALREKYEKYNIENFKDGNSKFYKSFFLMFDYPEYLVRLAVLLISDKSRNLIYKKYDENLVNVLARDNITSTDNSTISTLVRSQMNRVLEFLSIRNINEGYALYLMSSEGRKDLDLFRVWFKKNKKITLEILNSMKALMEKDIYLLSTYGFENALGITLVNNYGDVMTLDEILEYSGAQREIINIFYEDRLSKKLKKYKVL